jgi:AcrR family transcriptional regulator
MTTKAAPTPKPRISQRDRRRTAERTLLDTTVALLTEQGYAAATTLEVQKQAGMSRGQLLYYYGSRAELIGATTRHLYATRIGELRVRAAEMAATTNGHPDPVLLLWELVSGPLGRASLELWSAARHDEELRELVTSLEHELGRANLDMCRSLFGEPAASHPKFQDFCLVLLSSMIGASAGTVVPQGKEARHLLDAWRQLADAMLAPAPKRRSTVTK